MAKNSQRNKGGYEMILEIIITTLAISAWIIAFCEAFEVWED